jgi:hypothetical protein
MKTEKCFSKKSALKKAAAEEAAEAAETAAEEEDATIAETESVVTMITRRNQSPRSDLLPHLKMV